MNSDWNFLTWVDSQFPLCPSPNSKVIENQPWLKNLTSGLNFDLYTCTCSVQQGKDLKGRGGHNQEGEWEQTYDFWLAFKRAMGSKFKTFRKSV